MRQFYEVRGKSVPPDKLVRIDEGNWVEPRPVYCPGGHRMRPHLAGWIACVTEDRTGHRTHECECGQVVYMPPRDEPVCRCEDPNRSPRVM